MGEWPDAHDLPVDRARQVAQEYRRALRRADRLTCDIIDRAAEHVGETWVIEEYADELEDDLVSVRRAAELIGRSERWVYMLAARNPDLVLRRPMRIRVGDIRAAAARHRMTPEPPPDHLDGPPRD